MFNEIIYPNTQPATDDAEGSIGLVGVYSPSTIQRSLDLSSTDSLTTDYAVINPTTETTRDYSSWIYEPLLAPSALTGLTSNVSPLPIGEIHTLPIGTTVIDPTVTTPSTAIPISSDLTVTDQSLDINSTTDPVIPVDPTFVSDPIIETGFIATDITLDPSTAIPVSTDTTATDPSIVTPVSTDTTAIDPSTLIPVSPDATVTDQSPDINLSTDPVIPVDPTFVSDPIIETGFIATDVTLDPSTAIIPVSTDTTATDPSIVTPVSAETLVSTNPTATDPSTAIPISIDTSTTDTIVSDSSEFSYYTKDPIITADPSSIRYLTDRNEPDQPTEVPISTDPVLTIDPAVVTDPVLDTGTIATDSPEVIYNLTDTSIATSTDPTVTDTPVYKDPILTIDSISVSDPTVETAIATDITLGSSEATAVSVDPTTTFISSAATVSADTSTTDPIVSDATEYSYYTKDPIITTDPSSIRYLTDRNEPDQSTESSISTDPTITETPVYKDDLSTTDASVLTDSTVNDQSDVTILNYFRPTEINYREISFQPEKSIQLTDTLIVNPTIVAGINLFDLSAGNSISVSPAVTDSSPVSFLIDPSLALGSITETSHIATGKAKK